ncbi:hypothetical protein JTE90_017806 [Oedothorax gibbosus]|uniref:Uncharacterized protein n=1 Tax=Oedothorax gibbosus TaxID=931172 RepID=A0AAV6U566_9ARAC|nr:hypothetical protein JTE90_017806 [Oedothorax gibbosus]
MYSQLMPSTSLNVSVTPTTKNNDANPKNNGANPKTHRKEEPNCKNTNTLAKEVQQFVAPPPISNPSGTAKPETTEPNANSKRYNYKRPANKINPQNSIENFPGLPNRSTNAPAWGHNSPNNFPTTDSTSHIPNIDVQNQNLLLTALIGTITKLNARMDEMSATIIQLSQKVLAK